MVRIKVLLVEDSLTVRRYLEEVISADPQLELVGEAADGRRATELCRELRPDVIAMDMMLPVMDGLKATEHIMAFCPTPILIVSSAANRGEALRTYDALAAGAVDVLDKPSGVEQDDDWKRQLVDRLKLVARIKVMTHLRGRSERPLALPPAFPARPAAMWGRSRVIGVGVSTGGPAAMQRILAALPDGFPLPILLVIHIGRQFAMSLAHWLASYSRLPVAFAVDGEEIPRSGRVVMAPPDQHLTIDGGRLRLTLDAERHFCRPSVDVLFESLARELGPCASGFLLTGMGRDGATGLLAMRSAGSRTFAQDEASSVVFGMPREAIVQGAADTVLGLSDVAPAMVRLAAEPARRAV